MKFPIKMKFIFEVRPAGATKHSGEVLNQDVLQYMCLKMKPDKVV
jgi:hypothetical protein